MQYQKTLVDAMAKMRARDASAGTQIEDMMHVTTESKGRMQLSEISSAAPIPPGASSPERRKSVAEREEEEAQASVDALLEVDALTTPMQIALWRLVAWAQAKSEAEQGRLEGKGKKKMLGAALMSRAKNVSADEVLAASSSMDDEEEEEEAGDDPLADAPLDFEMVVVNLRLSEVSAKLLLDDSGKGGSPAEPDFTPMPGIEMAMKQAVMAAAPVARTITTTTTTANLDGSISTTTTVTTFKKPVDNLPLSNVIALSLTPIVVRARVAPKTATGVHLAVGRVLLEHQVGRGADETQPLICFHGNVDIPDTSPLLGKPMPIVEVPRKSAFGFMGGGGGSKPKPKPKPAEAAAEAAGEGGEAAALLAPAIHLVASLPPEPAPGDLPPDGSTDATLVIHRGEVRVAPHQMRELFTAFFTPLDGVLDLIPGASLTRAMVFELREYAESMLVKPWWGILNALPGVLEGVRDGVPALMPLKVEARITEGIALHLLGEPATGTALGTRHCVPVGSITLPPLTATVEPAHTDTDHQVRINLALHGDAVLGVPKAYPALRPLSGPGSAPQMDASQLSTLLLSEQLQLLDDLKSAREANTRLKSDLSAEQAASQAMAAELASYRLWPTAKSPAAARSPGKGGAMPAFAIDVGSPAGASSARLGSPSAAASGERAASARGASKLVSRLLPRRLNSPRRASSPVAAPDGGTGTGAVHQTL